MFRFPVRQGLLWDLEVVLEEAWYGSDAFNNAQLAPTTTHFKLTRRCRMRNSLPNGVRTNDTLRRASASALGLCEASRMMCQLLQSEGKPNQAKACIAMQRNNQIFAYC
jgi:hypothetical protein